MPKIEGVYALTPDVADTGALLDVVARALDGGVRLVQYRAKNASAASKAEQAGRLLALCRRHGAALFVNDDAMLAAQIGADGVHLGRDDASVADARRWLSRGAIIGVSCYDDLARARKLRAEGADYVAFGSFFASSVKPLAVRPAPALLAAARRALDCPIVAIGGITLTNAPDLIAAGADALAVITGLFAAPDVRARASSFGELFLGTPSFANP